MIGSRLGVIIVVCWGILMYFGEKGYVEIIKKIILIVRYIKKEWVLFFVNYNFVVYLKNLFEKGIECDILKVFFSSFVY